VTSRGVADDLSDVRKMEQTMIKIARRLFPRAGDKEAVVALSAVGAGVIGSIATLVTLVMMITGH
jgi:hypothetical protein